MEGEMERLLKLFLRKFIPLSVINKQTGVHHTDNMIAVGMKTRTYLAEEDGITPVMEKKFFATLHDFYVAAVQKMVDRFPFRDPVLPKLKVLDFSKREELTYSTVVDLAEHFLSGKVDIEELKEEWKDYQMEALEGADQLSLDTAWGKILSQKTALGKPRFPQMKILYTALLCLPHSNASCERAFSIVRKVHTEYRKSMLPATLTGYLQVKMNCVHDCFQLSLPTSLLSQAKSATTAYNTAQSDSEKGRE